MRVMMKSKIHCATVTEANLNYVGSITIDENLLNEVDVLAHEKVQIVNNNDGDGNGTERIAVERGFGVVCLDGAAAMPNQKDQIEIMIAYASINESELTTFNPKPALVEHNNKATQPADQQPHLTKVESI